MFSFIISKLTVDELRRHFQRSVVVTYVSCLGLTFWIYRLDVSGCMGCPGYVNTEGPPKTEVRSLRPKEGQRAGLGIR